MEILISVILGIWIMLAGVLCFIVYKKDFASLLGKKNEGKKEDRA